MRLALYLSGASFVSVVALALQIFVVAPKNIDKSIALQEDGGNLAFATVREQDKSGIDIGFNQSDASPASPRVVGFYPNRAPGKYYCPNGTSLNEAKKSLAGYFATNIDTINQEPTPRILLLQFVSEHGQTNNRTPITIGTDGKEYIDPATYKLFQQSCKAVNTLRGISIGKDAYVSDRVTYGVLRGATVSPYGGGLDWVGIGSRLTPNNQIVFQSDTGYKVLCKKRGAGDAICNFNNIQGDETPYLFYTTNDGRQISFKVPATMPLGLQKFQVYRNDFGFSNVMLINIRSAGGGITAQTSSPIPVVNHVLLTTPAPSGTSCGGLLASKGLTDPNKYDFGCFQLNNRAPTNGFVAIGATSDCPLACAVKPKTGTVIPAYPDSCGALLNSKGLTDGNKYNFSCLNNPETFSTNKISAGTSSDCRFACTIQAK